MTSVRLDFGSYNSAIYADNNSVVVNGSIIYKRRAVAVNTLILDNDYYIGVTNVSTAPLPRTITLPVITTAGKVFIIKDETGTASVNNIVIDTASSSIDSTVSKTININYGSLTVISNGSAYFVLSSDWENAFTTLLLADGSAASPSLSFTSNPVTGLYRIGADNLGFTTNGALSQSMNSNSQLISQSSGSAGSPSYGFNSLAGTGMYLSGTSLVLSTASTNALVMTSSQQLQMVVGSATTPSMSFIGGAGFSDKGMYSSASNILDFSTSTTNRLSLSTTTNTTTLPLTTSHVGSAASASYSFTGNPSTGMYQTTTGQLQFAVSGTESLLLNTSEQLICTSASSTISTPSLGFSGDIQTGVYRAGAGILGFTITGTEAFRINATRQITALSGTESLPQYSFTSDTSSGLWRPGTNLLAMSSNGTAAIRISSDQNVGINTTPIVGNIANSSKLATLLSITSAADSTGPKHNAKFDIIGEPSTGGTYAFTLDGVKSLITYAPVTGVNFTNDLASFRSLIVNNGASTSTITNVIGLVSDITSITSATNVITDAYGAYINNATGTGTITNQYGIQIAAMTKGSLKNYGLAVDTASNGTTPYSLIVSGTSSITKLLGGQTTGRTAIAGTTYSVLATDHYVANTAVPAGTPTVWTLLGAANANVEAGRIYEFKDESGLINATNFIRIDPSGTDAADGTASGFFNLTRPYEGIKIINSGVGATGWYSIGRNASFFNSGLPTVDGTLALPAVSFISDTTLGYYRKTIPSWDKTVTFVQNSTEISKFYLAFESGLGFDPRIRSGCLTIGPTDTEPFCQVTLLAGSGNNCPGPLQIVSPINSAQSGGISLIQYSGATDVDIFNTAATRAPYITLAAAAGYTTTGQIETGTVDASPSPTSTTFADSSIGGLATTDYFVNWTIRMTSGPANGDERIVSAYNFTTKVLTVSVAFSSTPTTGNTFELHPFTTNPNNTELGYIVYGAAMGNQIGEEFQRASAIDSTLDSTPTTETTTLTGVTSTSVFAATGLTSTVNDFYKGWQVRFITGPNAGQVREVTAYNGGTKTITCGTTFQSAFGTLPVVGNSFIIVEIVFDSQLKLLGGQGAGYLAPSFYLNANGSVSIFASLNSVALNGTTAVSIASLGDFAEDDNTKVFFTHGNRIPGTTQYVYRSSNNQIKSTGASTATVQFWVVNTYIKINGVVAAGTNSTTQFTSSTDMPGSNIASYYISPTVYSVKFTSGANNGLTRTLSAQTAARVFTVSSSFTTPTVGDTFYLYIPTTSTNYLDYLP